jgi:hypothetical protein
MHQALEDAVALERAAAVIKMRSNKPHAVAVRIACDLLNNIARDIRAEVSRGSPHSMYQTDGRP